MTTPYKASDANRVLRFENPLTAALLERRMNRLERVARNRQLLVAGNRNPAMVENSL